MSSIINIVLLSLVAGLGTGLGGLVAVIRKPGKRSFGLLMGIAAGVMISLAFLEMVNEAWELQGFWTATFGFAAGSLFMFFIDTLIPHIRFGFLENRNQDNNCINPSQTEDPPINDYPHRHRHRYGHQTESLIDTTLLKSGILVAIGITIHNIPEGIAVGAGYMHTPQFGMFIAMAILLHNIPEGIATALPLCKSGISKWRSFRVALFSGLAEPIGALVASVFLVSFQKLIPASLAFAGGVMVFITLDELIPTARQYGHHHFTSMGIIIGAIFVFILSGLFGV